MTRHLRRSALVTTREDSLVSTEIRKVKTDAFHSIAHTINSTYMDPEARRRLKAHIGAAHRSGQLGKGEKKALLVTLSERKPDSDGPLKGLVQPGRQEPPAARMEEPTVVTIKLPIGLRRNRLEF